MPPSAISKANAVAEKSKNALVELKDIGGGASIEVIKSSSHNPTPYPTGNEGDPICFEYTNSGTCSRIARGEICRYRHLHASHPDVIKDRVRQGKLPASALEAPAASPSGQQFTSLQVCPTPFSPAPPPQVDAPCPACETVARLSIISDPLPLARRF